MDGLIILLYAQIIMVQAGGLVLCAAGWILDGNNLLCSVSPLLPPVI